MSLTTIILIAGASWSILSISVGIPLGRSIKRADDVELADPEHVNWLPFLPPVPESDATWLDAWPVGNDDETRLRFDQIVSAEEWAS